MTTEDPPTQAPEDPFATGSFNPHVSDALAAFMQQGWGPLPQPTPPDGPGGARTQARRAQLARAIGDRALVVAAGLPRPRNGDQLHTYRADSDYVWLTGDQQSGGVLVMVPGEAAQLYLLPQSSRENGEFWRDGRNGELWVGRRPTLEAKSAELGIECRPLAELPARLAQLAGAGVSHVPGLDGSVDAVLGAEPALGDRELRAVVSELRLVKDDWEIDQLRAACAATSLGYDDIARLLGSGRSLTERDVEVAFESRARLTGNGPGYHTIAAAGAHAATLHWGQNDAPLVPGQLLLVDAGVETNSLYTSDFTRTMPVSGKFTPLQREVYDIVQASQQAAFAKIKPGEKFRAYYPEVARVLAEGLVELGVLPVSAAESVRADSELHRRWTLCSPGHMVGLDVHDNGAARRATYMDGVLVPGEVLTVEPGLYFQSNDETIPAELRGIGVRIEDNVLVTEDGYEMLSAGTPRTSADVEDWLAAHRA
ncbi:MAG: Xaa-Pro aminopeptidase [Actinomycetia bacterium]|nr:Xaa-Pro aminopeptidase [Actinomycetes bacterium]